jgi:formamidopyrimidine-DNA glycosylase
MPELPDISLYLHALKPRVVGQTLSRAVIASPFVLRTFEPPVDVLEGRTIFGLERLGKRIVFHFDGDLFLVVHLMIAGRFRWSDKPKVKLTGKAGLASFQFPHGTLQLVENATEKRAGIWVVQGRHELKAHDPGGIDLFNCSVSEFTEKLKEGNHTLKRALTDPRLFDGIGNAYSDEILHGAGLSPVKLTQSLSEEDIDRLLVMTRMTLSRWIGHLINEFHDRFPAPGDVTAFRPDFAVHGKYGQPCPVCGTTVQRIRYASNETNYCPRCQTEGKLLADRSLSRLLKKDWPRTIDELERSKAST